MYFREKSFYRHFARCVHAKPSEIQIVKLKRNKLGRFSLTVRTAENEQYRVRSTAFGKIEYLERCDRKEHE